MTDGKPKVIEDDFFIELLKAEWKETKKRILETGEVKLRDHLVYSTLKMKGELGDTEDLKYIYGGSMATKEQVATKESIDDFIENRMLTKRHCYWTMAIGLVIMTLIMIVIKLLARGIFT